jgi:hypothetical protein
LVQVICTFSQGARGQVIRFGCRSLPAGRGGGNWRYEISEVFFVSRCLGGESDSMVRRHQRMSSRRSRERPPHAKVAKKECLNLTNKATMLLNKRKPKTNKANARRHSDVCRGGETHCSFAPRRPAARGGSSAGLRGGRRLDVPTSRPWRDQFRSTLRWIARVQLTPPESSEYLALRGALP